MERKLWARVFVGVLSWFCLMVSFQSVGIAAQADKPITAKEWTAKTKLSWGPDYWPTKPVREGFPNGQSRIHRADESQPLAGERLDRRRIFLRQTHSHGRQLQANRPLAG